MWRNVRFARSARSAGPRLACCLLATFALTFPALAAAQDAAAPEPADETSAAPAARASSAAAPEAAAPADEETAAAERAAASRGLTASPDPRPRVVKAMSDATDPEHRNVAGLDDLLILEVERLEDGLRLLGGGCKDLVLFLDGIPIEGRAPLSCNPASGRVVFHLVRDDRSDSAWHALLGEPRGFTRPIRVSVGPTSEISWLTGVREFELELIPELPFYTYVASLALALILFVRLARSTSLLRDPHVVPSPGKRAPYSLARFQLAFWSFLVISAYVFLWLVTQELDTITGSVLALLGIGSGTALGASLIDAGKLENAAMADPAAVPPVPPVLPAGATDTSATAATSLPVAMAPPLVQDSQGFLDDLLKDARGVSLYRFQMFAWTLVLGIIFVGSVYDKLAMPQFSPTLLGLMGISSGTFLGAKFPEK